MKKFAILLFSLALGAFSSAAMAGTPNSVKDATGTKTYPTAGLLKIEKDTSSGNRVKLLYEGGATKYADDNGAWSVHAKFKSAMFNPVTSPVVGNGLVFDVAKAFSECAGGNTSIYYYLNANTETIADSCALDTAIKAASL